MLPGLRQAVPVVGVVNEDQSTTFTSEIKNVPITDDQFPKYPAFECSSGELLWGHLHTMIMGAKNMECDLGSDGKNSVTDVFPRFKYHVGAVKGKWVVERFLYSNSGECAGYVIHHEDYSGNELLERCKLVGISHRQQHNDTNIVYVNRYDWGCHFKGPNVEENLKLINPDFTFKPHITYFASFGAYDIMDGCRLNIVDAAEWNSIQRHFAFGQHPDETTCCQYVKGNHSIGIHLSQKNIEYELGWMIFSETSNDLVGFVYDPSYSALEGDLELEN